MKLELVPLLKVQRELYDMPRGMARFQEYLRVMANDRRDDLQLPPLGLMNSMGKDHIGPLLDSLLALGFETEVDRAVTKASEELSDVPGEFKMGILLVDDAKGGWTNRYSTEFSLRFETRPISKKECRREYQHWLSGVLWASEEPSVKTAMESALMPIYRVAYTQKHGVARTLGEDDFDYTRTVIGPHRGVDDPQYLPVCLATQPLVHWDTLPKA